MLFSILQIIISIPDILRNIRDSVELRVIQDSKWLPDAELETTSPEVLGSTSWVETRERLQG